MAKILFMNSLDERYGSTYRARDIRKSLKACGHSVTYIESNCTLDEKGVISINQPDSAAGYIAASFKRAYYALSNEYDILYVQKFTPLTCFAIFAGILRGKKVFVDWDDLDCLFQSTILRKALVKFIETSLPRIVDGITTHSSEICTEAGALGAQPVYIVPQIADTALFDPAKHDGGEARKRLGIGNRPVIGFAGTLTEGGSRDLDLIISIASLVTKSKPEVYFLVAGGGPLEDKYRKMITVSGIKDFSITGIVPHNEMPQYVSCMDVCLIYMRNENANQPRVSLKLLEYLSMNKVVAGKAVGESGRILSSYILSASDIEECSRLVLSLLNTNMRKPARPRGFILQNHSLDAMKIALKKVFANENL